MVQRPPGGQRIGERSGVSPDPSPVATAPRVESKPEIKQESEPRFKKRKDVHKKSRLRLFKTIGLQVAALGLVVLAGYLSVLVGLESKGFSEETEQGVAKYQELEESIKAVDVQISSLPSAAVAKRWSDNSRLHGEAVAMKQNLLISEMAELNYTDIPEGYKVETERELVPYTPEEREELALKARDERKQSAMRELGALFAHEDSDELGFNASNPWYLQLDIEESVDRVWVFNGPGYFTKEGAMPVSWTMYENGGEGEPIAVVSAVYDSERRVFTDLKATRVVKGGDQIESS